MADRRIYRGARYAAREIWIDGVLYLRRRFLTSLSWRWRLFLHCIHRPDAGRDLHDHPWDFWTVCLWGGYVEVVAAPFDSAKHESLWPVWHSRVEKTVWLWPRFRRAEHTHRIIDVKPNTWTLVFARRAERRWGFRLLSAPGWSRGTWQDAVSYLGDPNAIAPEDQVE